MAEKDRSDTVDLELMQEAMVAYLKKKLSESEDPLSAALLLQRLAVEMGDLTLAGRMITARLAYMYPKPEPKPPEVNSRISIDPYEVSEDEWAERHGAKPREKH